MFPPALIYSQFGNSTSKISVTVEQNLIDLNNNSKEFVREFKAKAEKERDNVLTALAQYKQDLHGSHDVHYDELAGVYRSLKTAAGNSNMKDNPLFQQTKQIIHLSRAILKLYQIADKESQQPKLTVPREAWRQDQKKMDRLLYYGKQHGERLAENIISPAEEHSNGRIPAQADMSETEDIAMSLFDNTTKEAGEGTWGRTAHAQLKALMSVVRTLPLSRDTDSQSQQS
ncbi:hypothetical protein B0T26DRAFT_726653 [Lasiosphaeria miniovina]|uniref:Uncharacterized protein n=1 Tax=Lasiosphaeria miniovina TaxID=1954250 RepID=A0AA40DK04_9PEZI|nr:uncharacterized protein B0T26DRAFT_726653 [Lasiosphaeria miniovina]KAK0706459.1 hypothetical protein B0T26DRAFT_726653 [Lasiosphaeria miniovina]